MVIIMSKLTYVKKAVITAACIALCVVLPMAFHAVPHAGSIYSPMHIPVLLCGLLCGMPFGFLCGLAGPALSSLITGRPTVAYLPPMIIELVVYGFVSGLMMRFVKTKNLFADLYISLVSAMLMGRVAGGAVKALIFTPEKFSFTLWISSYFVKALPGVVIQLALIPAIVFALEKARLIPLRYKRKEKENG